MSEVLIRASSKKVLPIFDEEKYEKIKANELAHSTPEAEAEKKAQDGAIVKISVKPITRVDSKRYTQLQTNIVKSAKSADKETGEGVGDDIFEMYSEMVMLYVCDESKEAMNALLDKSIACEEIPKIVNRISALFHKESDEKKPGSESLTTQSSSPSAESDSTNKDSSDPVKS